MIQPQKNMHSPIQPGATWAQHPVQEVMDRPRLMLKARARRSTAHAQAWPAAKLKSFSSSLNSLQKSLIIWLINWMTNLSASSFLWTAAQTQTQTQTRTQTQTQQITSCVRKQIHKTLTNAFTQTSCSQIQGSCLPIAPLKQQHQNHLHILSFILFNSRRR